MGHLASKEACPKTNSILFTALSVLLHSSLSGTIEHPALFVNALLCPLTQFIPRQRGSGSQRASYVVKAFLPGRHLATSLLTWGVRSLIDLNIRGKFNSLFRKHSSPYKSMAYLSSSTTSASFLPAHSLGSAAVAITVCSTSLPGSPLNIVYTGRA